jgi:hypothetical protein
MFDLPQDLPQAANVAPEEFEALMEELVYATKWGTDFDRKNTLNDWVTYINIYASNAARMDQEDPHAQLIKAAGLALTAATYVRKNKVTARHYD